MRINFPCERCETWYTLQTPDGIGPVGVTITCPCGNSVHQEFTPPPTDEGALKAMAQETVHGKTHVGGTP